VRQLTTSTISEVVFVLGWVIVGFVVGFSVSFVEIVRSLMTRKDLAGSLRKLRNCVIGGTVGGIIGGLVAVTVAVVADEVFKRDGMWTPTALGFVAIGACIGLLVGLAQIILKEAWIKVEAGFRPGREMLLAKEQTTIGRAEGSDIALFGDMGVEKAHAFIVLEGGRYYLVDQGTPGGSFVNDQKVDGRMPLTGGDLIKLGKSALRFNERAKR
jgi:MFS family permease